MNHARRNLISGRNVATPPPLRPPWTTSETVLKRCTGCGACADTCPEGIISIGSGSLPELSFAAGECTFCGACAEACGEGVFAGWPSGPAFDHRAEIGTDCLARHDVTCLSCSDACPEVAIRLRPRLGQPAMPELDPDRCNGCGACVASCPADAISVTIHVVEVAHA